MNKTNIEIRKIFLRMNKAGSTAKEISEVLGVKIRNIYNWKKMKEEDLLREPDKSTRVPTFDVSHLKQYIEDHPFAFNKEVGTVFGKSKSTINRWRHKLGFKRKKAKTTYKEAKPELKKTSPKI